ncbi:hypothetical protein [Paremcibacter congregatus]|uniref:hypothetical protein n=1 Tax=Paremcibacter congregatus TaxID=2043170 RepID=UPI003A949482
MYLRKMIITLGLLASLSLSVLAEEDKDVSFVVLGKTPAYSQDSAGKISHKKHYLFGEIFLKSGGSLKAATLTTPEGAKYDVMDFTDAGHVWKIKRQDFRDQAEMDAAFPDGEYVFSIETGTGQTYRENISLMFREGHEGYTKPITIYFYQVGKLVSQDHIDPDKDLVVRWSPFTKGRQDPNGIADDLIFAMSFDCHGKSFARSTLPFVETPALIYSDRAFRIPADRLQAGATYKIIVEHAELVETKLGQGDIKFFATFPSVTDTLFRTTGESTVSCPAD